MNATRYVDLPECYQALNLTEGVSWEEVKKAYYQLAKQYHPDKNPNDLESENRFKQISIAFGVLERYYRNHPRFRRHEFSNGKGPVLDLLEKLKEEQKRRVRSFVTVDRTEFTPASDSGEEVLEAEQVVEPGPKEGRDGVALPAFSRRLLEGWSRLYAFLQKVERRLLFLDLEKTVPVEAHTAMHGSTVRIRTPGGTFNVRIPPGTQEDLVMRIPQKGERGFFNRKRGDLVLKIQVLPSHVRQGEDFYYQVQVTRKDLSLGQVMVLETHEGPIRYALPKDTVTGQTFVLKARPDNGHGASANHIIVVEVQG